jgi:hypothetical protein
MEEEDITVFHAKEMEYVLMKLIMINHLENLDVKVVLEQNYANVEKKKIIALTVKEYLYVNTINVEDDVLYAIQIVKSYVLAAKVLPFV